MVWLESSLWASTTALKARDAISGFIASDNLIDIGFCHLA